MNVLCISIIVPLTGCTFNFKCDAYFYWMSSCFPDSIKNSQWTIIILIIIMFLALTTCPSCEQHRFHIVWDSCICIWYHWKGNTLMILVKVSVWFCDLLTKSGRGYNDGVVYSPIGLPIQWRVQTFRDLSAGYRHNEATAVNQSHVVIVVGHMSSLALEERLTVVNI